MLGAKKRDLSPARWCILNLASSQAGYHPSEEQLHPKSLTGQLNKSRMQYLQLSSEGWNNPLWPVSGCWAWQRGQIIEECLQRQVLVWKDLCVQTNERHNTVVIDNGDSLRHALSQTQIYHSCSAIKRRIFPAGHLPASTGRIPKADEIVTARRLGSWEQSIAGISLPPTAWYCWKSCLAIAKHPHLRNIK